MTHSVTNANSVSPPGPVMLDLEGLVLTDLDCQRICHPLTGGVILFARNFSDRAQLIALTTEIHQRRPGLLIAVDHEGGRIQRFQSDGFTSLPPMRRLGQLWDRDSAAASKLATDVGFILAAELRACGVDLSFTPILDLDHGASAVIGDRAFHRDPAVVTQLAKNLNYGLALAGMANCGKHFPGHGFAAADSHVAVPVDSRTLAQILAEDAAPYGGLGLALAAVMPAHVVYPEVDAMPAGFSRKWLSILRDDLSFDGLIFSDDLSMEGASVAGDVVSAATVALQAGCDMVLICNAPALANRLLERLDPAVARGDGSSARRIASLVPAMPALDWNALQSDRRYRAACLRLAEQIND